MRPVDPPTAQRAQASTSLVVAGTTAVAALLLTGRWGSYLGVPSQAVYLTDVLLVGTAGWMLGRHRDELAEGLQRLAAHRRTVLPLAALLTWVLVRLAIGGVPDRDALRDVAPYVYAVSAVLPWLTAVGDAAWRRTLQVITAALVVHLLWVTPSQLDPSLSEGLPLLGGKVRVLELRADFDGAVLAVTAGVLLASALSRRTSGPARLACLAGALWSVLLIGDIANRAAVLALLAVLVLLLLDRLRTLLALPRPMLLGGLAALTAVAALLLPQSTLYGRLTGSPEFTGVSASGTTDARIEAWTDVLRYMQTSPTRVVAGVGFGTDFLQESGGDVPFEGTVFRDVRAPHNYLINTYARLGLVGVGLLLWTLTAVFAASVRLLRARSALALPLAMIVVALAAASLVGVILESPFGAVPFFWALGGLVLLDVSRRSVPTPAYKVEPSDLLVWLPLSDDRWRVWSPDASGTWRARTVESSELVSLHASHRSAPHVGQR